MKHIPGVIYHKELLEIITRFRKSTKGKLQLPFTSVSARMRPSGFEFDFIFSYLPPKGKPDLRLGRMLKKIPFKTTSGNFIVENLFLGKRSLPLVTASSSQIYTQGYSKTRKYFYRLFIPLSGQLSILFQIEDAVFVTNLGYRSRNGLVAVIDNLEYYACIFRSKGSEYFLTIESRAKMNWEDFSKKAHAIKNGIGYLTGHLAGNAGYYFAYHRTDMEIPDHFYFSVLRKEITISKAPLNENPYSFIRNHKLAEKYYRKKTLRKVNGEEFSRLCQKIHDSTALESCLVLMMEAGAASLLFMPGGYAIALETLSDLIIGKTKLKLSPIKSKSISKKIREECKSIIVKYGHGIDADELKTLNIRIEQLNQQTNKARLKAPFDLLGISLLDKDVEVLETRNDFLHGRFPDISKAGPLRSERRLNLDLYYVAMRFYTLLNLLILKWIGFDNYIINYPAIATKTTGIRLSEDPFRKV